MENCELYLTQSDLYDIPHFICDYRLTYHIGGLYYLLEIAQG